MGRGRAKAKQAKVARELKYRTPKTDLEALQRELQANRTRTDVDDPYADPYAEHYDDPDDDEEAAWARRR